MIDTKLTGYTPDITKENVATLRQLFPEICCEDRIDFEKLRQLLGEYVEDRQERYNFTWNGKCRALRLSQQPTRGTLRPCPEESKDWETTNNLYLEGDNLEVLKLLQKSYHGKVKMIYIDPPYNTGNDFVYPDDYSDNLRNYLRLTGQVDEEGKAYSANPESNGRYHSDWLNMMYPRLRLAKNLLSDDGVILISIDENEVAQLRKICDEVFGESNFEATIIPIVNPGGRDYKQIAVTHEYLLMYSKSSMTEINELPKAIEFTQRDSLGGFEYRELRNRNPKFHSGNRPNLFYPFFVNPKISTKDGYCAVSLARNDDYCVEVRPYNSQGAESVWRWGKTKANENIIDGNLDKSQLLARKKSDGCWNIYEKTRITTLKAKSVWSETEMRTENGTREVRALFGETYFDHPKPITLIQRCAQLITVGEDIILDFFSGSATTAHAVMQLNAEDGGHRRFIMVQLPEPCKPDSKAYQAGYKTICDIGKERIRRAGEKIKTELREKSGGQTTLDGSGTTQNPDELDIGFKVFKLDTSNILAWQPDTDNLNKTLTDYVDNLDPTRSELDLVYELMIKEGLSLTEQIEEILIAGKNIYSIGYGLLQICLDDHITDDVVREMVNHKPEENIDSWRVIFKDNGFASDSDKLNARESLKAAGLAEEAFRTI